MHAENSAESAPKVIKPRAKRGTGMVKEERRHGKVVGWVATLPIPGERPLTFRAQTMKEVMAKRDEFKAKVARGEAALVAGRVKRRAAERAAGDEQPKVVITVSVADHVNYWLNSRVKPNYERAASDDPEARREGGRQPTTYANYRWEMDKYVLPRIGTVRFDRLDEDVIEGLWQDMKAARVPYTMRYKVLVDLRTAVNYTLKHRPKSTSLRWNPVAMKLATLEAPHAPEKPPVDYDLLGRAINAARGLDRIELVLHIGLRTGLRRGNICGLRFGDFGEDGTLVVQQRVNRVKGLGVIARGGLKGKKDSATSTKATDAGVFAPLLAEQRKRNMERYVANRSRWTGPDPRSPEAPLFPTRYGTPCDPQEIYRGLKKLFTSCGAPKYTVHQMRHDFLGQVIDAQRANGGVDLLAASRLMDHSTPQVTTTVYAHLAQETLNTSFISVSTQLDARINTVQEKAV